MPAIHLIKKSVGGLPPITKVAGEANTYTSGFWTLSEDTARSLIHCRIYFHERQREPSFYGGEIVGVERLLEGEYKDKIVFRFEFSADCRGVRTTRVGWSQEMKLSYDEF